MKSGDAAIYNYLQQKLASFDVLLPGIDNPIERNCFILQIIDSIRRIKYVLTIRNRPIDFLCADATSNAFDPLKASIWHARQGNLDEAFWLTFLSTHFGKNLRTGWNLVRNLYGGFNEASMWTWNHINMDSQRFLDWLDDNEVALRASGSFGNHRKYESLSAYNPIGTGTTIMSYLAWANPNHQAVFNLNGLVLTPREKFDTLYNSMSVVSRFGRTARFDFLTMVGKMGLTTIEPGSTYMNGATGPLAGAKLLFGNGYRTNELEVLLGNLESHLEIYFGMQVLEDALCNWQKNPSTYIHFKG